MKKLLTVILLSMGLIGSTMSWAIEGGGELCGKQVKDEGKSANTKINKPIEPTVTEYPIN